MTVEALAPTGLAAGYAIARPAFAAGEVPWVQVVVSEWSSLLGEFVEPHNAIVFARDDPAPGGADQVVLIGVADIDEP